MADTVGAVNDPMGVGPTEVATRLVNRADVERVGLALFGRTLGDAEWAEAVGAPSRAVVVVEAPEGARAERVIGWI